MTAMMSNHERLIYMVNQIARNFATLGEDKAAAATADHLASFWDPRMKAQILACRGEGEIGLSPIAARAVANLANLTGPVAQTGGTQFNAVDEAGHSDAG
jgi:formate dehydrogenase subunit delta